MDIVPKRIRIYERPNGEAPFTKWTRGLRDLVGKKAIEARVARIASGNFGDHRFISDGVTELRINIGPGYRVYIGQDQGVYVVLLCGGDKGTQNADIAKAKSYWQDYQLRK